MTVREEKAQVVETMKSTLSEAKGAVLVNYSGLTVAQATDLRRKCLAENVEYKVIKNTLTRIAANELGLEKFGEELAGPSALASSTEDATAPARIIADYIKENKSEALEIKAGLLEGKILDAAKVTEIAKLPNREGLLSMLLSVLQAPVRNVAYAVKAVAEAKDGGEETVA